MAEKRIEIISDVDAVITFEKIETDSVNRNEVAMIEERIEAVKAEIADKNAELEALIEKVAYAKHIIALADEKKAKEEAEALAEENAEVPAEEVVTE